jgi:hypothetical protein
MLTRGRGTFSATAALRVSLWALQIGPSDLLSARRARGIGRACLKDPPAFVPADAASRAHC